MIVWHVIVLLCLIVSPSVPARRHPRRPLTVVTRLPA